MRKLLKDFRFKLEYVIVAVVSAILSVLPFSVGRFFCNAVADVWRCIDGRHRRFAIEQSMARLGIGEAEARVLVKNNYRHFALIFLEVVKLRGMSMDEILRRTDLNGCDELFRDILARGKGVVMLTGHLGNWEWGCLVTGMLGAAAGAIARPLDNPYLDGYLNAIRGRTGVAVWSKFNCVRRALAVLKRGEGFMAVVDQDGGKKGCMIPFLGVEGSTMTVPVDLAIRFGAPIFVGAMIRRAGPGRFILERGRVHWPREGADPESERVRLLTDVNEDLSNIIRKYPEQWIWIHKRWKTSRVHNQVKEAGQVRRGERDEIQYCM